MERRVSTSGKSISRTYSGDAENTHSVELAELTGITLLQVDLAISWGKPPREQTRYFSTIKAVLSQEEDQP